MKLSSDYWQRIPGGKILARHLGYLQLQATGVETPDLLQEQKIDGEWILSLLHASFYYLDTLKYVAYAASSTSLSLPLSLPCELEDQLRNRV